MTETVIKLPGTDLASRQTAARVRYNVANSVLGGNAVVVDLSEIESVSYSYADELFGVMVATEGFDWLIEQVKIVNAKEHVLRVIAEVINRRLKENNQPIRHRA